MRSRYEQATKIAGIPVAPDATQDSINLSWLRALQLTKPIVDQPFRTLPVIIDELSDKFDNAPALLSDFECFTFRVLASRSNRYARWALDQDVAKGDVVCLLMPNRPEYMAIWLGITHIGGTVALVNTNLSGSSLAHCIDIAGADHIIVADDLMAGFADAQRHLTTNPKVWIHGDGKGHFPDIASFIENLSNDRLSDAGRCIPSISDRALLIYTSGTTGLPKASNVSHRRLMTWSLWFAGMMNTQSSDRMYNCLPMYHSIGGVVATGAVLVNGGSVVIRDKFSTTRFWDDVVGWDCTLFQYIGELCRYLVLAPAHRDERKHRLRLCCGNGLRPDVWSKFKKRFQIPHILEFYAATEGNVTLFNCEEKPGAIGRIPAVLAHRSPAVLVRYDTNAGKIVRNEYGHCIRCAPGETGEAIGRLPDAASNVGNGFEGYTNSHDSEKKIVRDVLKHGDAWFRTGDLMRQDENGFFYFIDRIGDTFRWKGENVSTTEVSEAITEFTGVIEASVYGVEVPGTEGRAGMAALVVTGMFDLVAFRKHLAARLPGYACPLFLRMMRELDHTVTFKQKKSELARDGYDPTAIKDVIYFNDGRRNAFVRLDEPLYQAIQSGKVRM